MEITEAQAQRLIAWLETTDALEQMSNAKLADLLIEHVWATMPLGSPQSDLVAEIAARLKGER